MTRLHSQLIWYSYPVHNWKPTNPFPRWGCKVLALFSVSCNLNTMMLTKLKYWDINPSYVTWWRDNRGEEIKIFASSVENTNTFITKWGRNAHDICSHISQAGHIVLAVIYNSLLPLPTPHFPACTSCHHWGTILLVTWTNPLLCGGATQGHWLEGGWDCWRAFLEMSSYTWT